jgi:hypothetical protein
VPDPGDARRDDAHMRRGDHGIAAARHIAPDTADRDVPVPEYDPRQCLDLDIVHRAPLDLGEIADLRLREFDVLDRLRRDFVEECGNLVLGEAEARRRPFVEPLRHFAHRRVAPFGDIRDDALDDAADLGVGLFVLAGQRRPLDLPGHCFLLFDARRLHKSGPSCEDPDQADASDYIGPRVIWILTGLP